MTISEVRPQIATVTLQRPATANALEPSLVEELAGALEALGRDNSIRVVVLTGAGADFCIGMPVSPDGAPDDPAAAMRSQERLAEVFLLLRRIPQPVIAAVDLADELCALSPFGVVMTKEVMWANLAAPSLEVAVHLENRTQILGSRSGDFEEAVRAFAEKRAPDFRRSASPGPALQRFEQRPEQ